jgi:hypothetical protein
MELNRNDSRGATVGAETQPENAVDPRLVEMLRSALAVVAQQQHKAEEEKEKKAAHPREDTTPLFWKLCSAALMSVAAMIAVTLYNQLSSSVGSLRNELHSLRERSGDLVRKDEYNNRNVALAATIQRVEANNKANLARWEKDIQKAENQQHRTASDLRLEIKQLERDLQHLRERLSALEREGPAPANPKKKPLKDRRR